MLVLPPEKDPRNYPREPITWRDWAKFAAGLLTVVTIILFAYALVIPGWRHWGWGYVAGMAIGIALTNVYARIVDGHWPGEHH